MTQWRLTVECPTAETDRLLAELAEAGTSGVLEEDLLPDRCRLTAYFAERHRAEAVAAQWSAAVEAEAERDWVAVARAQWRELEVGRSFFLVPDDSAQITRAGRLRLRMRSGLAAGSGWHPATRLALEALEDCLRPGDTVLDLGTGSGILAAAAALLGAGVVFACDIDAAAACVAQQNLRDDGVPAALFVGSVRSVRARSLDLIVANLHAPALQALCGDLARTLKPGGRAVVSGFSSEQAPPLSEMFASKALAPAGRRVHDGWACLILETLL
jgi:ribosomal protein L11 methyltransferase